MDSANSNVACDEQTKVLIEAIATMRALQRLSHRILSVNRTRFFLGELIDEPDKEPVFVANQRRIEELRSELSELAKLHPAWQAVFTELDGLPVHVAAGIIAEVRDIQRFPSLEKIRSYAGTAQRPQGNQALRMYLYLAAEELIANNPAWKSRYEERSAIVRPRIIERAQSRSRDSSEGSIRVQTEYQTRNWIMRKIIDHVWRKWPRPAV